MFDFKGLGMLRWLFQNKKYVFIHTILAKWYIIIITGSITVTYTVFKKLEQRGILDKVTVTIEDTMSSMTQSAKCITLLDPKKIWRCLDHPERYRGDDN